MGRPKRQKPNDLKTVHDRRATSSNKGVEQYLQPEEVDDPYEPGATIIVMRQRRDDPLGSLKSHHSITEAQYQGGRAFQGDFECIERGAQAVDPSKPYVDCSPGPQGTSDAYSKALARLNVAHRALGMIGSALAHDVLIHGHGISELPALRGLVGRKWEDHFSSRFGECLDILAELWGFSNGSTQTGRNCSRRKGI